MLWLLYCIYTLLYLCINAPFVWGLLPMRPLFSHCFIAAYVFVVSSELRLEWYCCAISRLCAVLFGILHQSLELKPLGVTFW